MYRRSRRHKKFPDLALAILGVVGRFIRKRNPG